MPKICVAGNLVADKPFYISAYPAKGELATIVSQGQMATGGAVCNVLMSLARLDPSLSLAAAGIVGEDREGDFILDAMGRYPNIDCAQLRREGTSAFTLVLTDEKDRQRTFFTYRGANARFNETSIDWDALDCTHLHVGYMLLLDSLDAWDEVHGSRMARLMCMARDRGLTTSMDMVSEADPRCRALAAAALRFCDDCIINEIEAKNVTGVVLRDDGGVLHTDRMPEALGKLMDMGLRRCAIIHAPEGGYGMDAARHYERLDSIALPPGYIKGTVGAGDAFCAGALLGIVAGEGLRAAIRLGIGAAACALAHETATEGIPPREDVEEFLRVHGL